MMHEREEVPHNEQMDEEEMIDKDELMHHEEVVHDSSLHVEDHSIGDQGEGGLKDPG